VPGEMAGSGSNPIYYEGCGYQWILHSTGIQILRASAAPREIKSALRALRVLRVKIFLFLFVCASA
jgi:hypothetical protein